MSSIQYIALPTYGKNTVKGKPCLKFGGDPAPADIVTHLLPHAKNLSNNRMSYNYVWVGRYTMKGQVLVIQMTQPELAEVEKIARRSEREYIDAYLWRSDHWEAIPGSAETYCKAGANDVPRNPNGYNIIQTDAALETDGADEDPGLTGVYARYMYRSSKNGRHQWMLEGDTYSIKDQLGEIDKTWFDGQRSRSWRNSSSNMPEALLKLISNPEEVRLVESGMTPDAARKKLSDAAQADENKTTATADNLPQARTRYALGNTLYVSRDTELADGRRLDGSLPGIVVGIYQRQPGENQYYEVDFHVGSWFFAESELTVEAAKGERPKATIIRTGTDPSTLPTDLEAQAKRQMVMDGQKPTPLYKLDAEAALKLKRERDASDSPKTADRKYPHLYGLGQKVYTLYANQLPDGTRLAPWEEGYVTAYHASEVKGDPVYTVSFAGKGAAWFWEHELSHYPDYGRTYTGPLPKDVERKRQMIRHGQEPEVLFDIAMKLLDDDEGDQGDDEPAGESEAEAVSAVVAPTQEQLDPPRRKHRAFSAGDRMRTTSYLTGKPLIQNGDNHLENICLPNEIITCIGIDHQAGEIEYWWAHQDADGKSCTTVWTEADLLHRVIPAKPLAEIAEDTAKEAPAATTAEPVKQETPAAEPVATVQPVEPEAPAAATADVGDGAIAVPAEPSGVAGVDYPSYSIGQTVYTNARIRLDEAAERVIRQGTPGTVVKRFNIRQTDRYESFGYMVSFETLGLHTLFERTLQPEPLSMVSMRVGRDEPIMLLMGRGKSMIAAHIERREAIINGQNCDEAEDAADELDELQEETPAAIATEVTETPTPEAAPDPADEKASEPVAAEATEVPEPEVLVTAVEDQPAEDEDDRDAKDEAAESKQPVVTRPQDIQVSDSVTAAIGMVRSVERSQPTSAGSWKQEYVGELSARISGGIHCYGYAVDRGKLLYINMGGAFTGVEGIRGALQAGMSANLMPKDSSQPAVQLRATGEESDEPKMGEYARTLIANMRGVHYRQIIMLHREMVNIDYTQNDLTCYVFERNAAEFAALVRFHVMNTVDCAVHSEWADYLVAVGRAAALVREIESAGCHPVHALELDKNAWHRIITSGLEQGRIALPAKHEG